MGAMMRNSQVSLAICAVLGAAFITACQPAGSGTSATPSSAPPSASAVSSPSSPGGSPSSNAGGSSISAGSSSSAGSASQSVPGVIDCGKSLSKLEVQPTSLLLVCSDGTAGLKNLTWSHWGHNITSTGSSAETVPSATATGTGEFFLNDCNPSCAQGHDHTYPVRVTLSVVYSSPSPQSGTYFGQASLTWQGNRPPAGTKSTYLLPDPAVS